MSHEKKGKLILPAIAGRMGARDYFVSVMSLREIADRVSMPADYIKNKAIKNKLQCESKSSRVREIQTYLETNDERFFNALVIGVFGSPQWQSFSNLPPPFDNYQSNLGFITMSGEEKMYAIDGQHRLSGIQKYIGESKNKQALDESVSVIFLDHEDSDKGRIKSRRIFTTLSKKTIKVAKRDIIYLDEDDTMALLTRRFIIEKSGLFSLKEKRINEAVENQIPKNDTNALTTAGTLYDSLALLLPLLTDKGRKELSDKQLSKAEMDKAAREVIAFFEKLAENIPELREYFRANNPSSLARIAGKYRNAKTGGHLIFRPMGMKIIVELCCEIYKHKRKSRKQSASSLTPSNIMQESVAEIKTLKGYMHLNKTPCVDLVWSSLNGTITTKNFRTLKSVYLYMLSKHSGIDYYPKNRVADLAKKYQESTGHGTLPQCKKGINAGI